MMRKFMKFLIFLKILILISIESSNIGYLPEYRNPVKIFIPIIIPSGSLDSYIYRRVFHT